MFMIDVYPHRVTISVPKIRFNLDSVIYYNIQWMFYDFNFGIGKKRGGGNLSVILRI